MKVYVIKNEQGQYQTPDMSFISSIWQADLFNDYEVAKCYCERDCEIIECELMQATELADYTKQEKKEVVQEIKKKIIKHHEWKYEDCYTNSDIVEEVLDIIEEKLQQLQGENK